MSVPFRRLGVLALVLLAVIGVGLPAALALGGAWSLQEDDAVAAPVAVGTAPAATTSADPTTEPTTDTTTEPTAEPPGPRVIGHRGAAGVHLGDTIAEVRPTGVRLSGADGECRWFALPGQPADHWGAVISPGIGVAAIFGGPRTRTAEGVRPGTPRAELERAYPTVSRQVLGFRRVDLGDGVSYEFQVGRDGTVDSVALVDARQRCFD